MKIVKFPNRGVKITIPDDVYVEKKEDPKEDDPLYTSATKKGINYIMNIGFFKKETCKDYFGNINPPAKIELIGKDRAKFFWWNSDKKVQDWIPFKTNEDNDQLTSGWTEDPSIGWR